LKAQNVLFILCDQLRKDAVGVYGHPSAKTPHLDRLANGGLRCEHNIVAAPICMPNRWSMLTGRHIRNHGCWTNGLLLNPLPPTLPDHLLHHGIRTASFGKIHCTPTGTQDPGSWESKARWKALVEAGEDLNDHTGPYLGFEHVELTLGHGPSNACDAHYGQWFRENGGTPEMMILHKDPENPEHSGVRDMPVELHHSRFVADRTSAWLRDRAGDGKRFFAQVSFPDPHHPFDPPRDAADQVDPLCEPAPIPAVDDLADRPAHYRQRRDGQWSRKGLKPNASHPGGIADEHVRTLRARTTAMMNLIDEAVGQILKTLDETGLAEDTLILFTSDHGEGLGDHGIFGKGPWGYRSIIETPLILHGPGVAKGVSDAVISDVDLAPSICGMLDVPVLPYADGLDLSGHWKNPSAPTRDFALIEYRNGFGDQDNACAGLVAATETYLRYEDGEEELTDLTNDPEEHVNVSPERPERCAELRGELVNHLLQTSNQYPDQISHA